MLDRSSLIDRLLAWYDRHRRILPWRAQPGVCPNPYHVWLSEIMLQQTTVAAVIPYFDAFRAAFPTIQALAEAPEQQVMRAWAGLGYYARARNLHRCAQRLAAMERFPADPAALRALPGIGPYTATAIAAIAFDIPGIPIDGNVERVLSRLHAIATPLPAAKPAIAAAAAALAAQPTARLRPSDTAQALFDLGATLCTSAAPVCALCPWRADCAGLAQGIQAALPRKAPKPARPIRHGAAFHLSDAAGRILLRRRPPSGLLGGMSELPGTPWRAEPWPATEALVHAPSRAAWRHAGRIRHVFTHFEVQLDVYAAHLEFPVAGCELTAPTAAALPSVMQKCLAIATRQVHDASASAFPSSRRNQPLDVALRRAVTLWRSQ